MEFEFLTLEEITEHGLSPEEAAWEEAARKREATQGQALAETIQEITAKVQENTRKMEGILERLQEPEGPTLVLVETETGDDA
jgi:murein L,D-transpeptidase YcbB/YkuD